MGILFSFVMRSFMVGLLAASVALGFGLIGSWAAFNFIFESKFEIIWGNAVVILVGGIVANLATGVLFAIRQLSRSTANELRHLD